MKYMLSKVITIGLIAILLVGAGCNDYKEDMMSSTDDVLDEINTTLIEDIEEQRIHLSDQALLDKRKTDSINANLKWELLPCGLYKNKNQDIGFKVTVALEKEIHIDKYLFEFNGMNELKLLKSVIDTTTFRYLGNSFYKDKDHIYQYFEMRDGGFFTVFTVADCDTFQIIGDCFAKDKDHVYSERSGIITGADAKTFNTARGIGCFAKDKDRYYFWDKPIEIEDVDKEIVRKLKEVCLH